MQWCVMVWYCMYIVYVCLSVCPVLSCPCLVLSCPCPGPVLSLSWSCLSVCLSVCLPACLSVCLSVRRSVSLCVCLSVCLCEETAHLAFCPDCPPLVCRSSWARLFQCRRACTYIAFFDFEGAELHWVCTKSSQKQPGLQRTLPEKETAGVGGLANSQFLFFPWLQRCLHPGAGPSKGWRCSELGGHCFCV